MILRRVFQMDQDFDQHKSEGICTIASLQWCKRSLELGRGLQRYSELNLTDHRLNELMVAYRADANDPVKQTATMGLRIQGTGDRAVDTVMHVNQIVINSQSRHAIFWNGHHTMGYAARRRGDAMEYEFFDNEDGLYRANNFVALALTINRRFQDGNYGAVEGVRVVAL